MPPVLTVPQDLARRLEGDEVLARYAWENGSEPPIQVLWASLGADVLVPVTGIHAVLVLGPKASGRPYNVTDITFLRSAANQIALGMTNARAFAELEGWNVNLERQVLERTLALEDANRELQHSVGEVRAAYKQLETQQAILIRSDRMATLGRLTAGIAHEVNTPLGATLNALNLIHKLAGEYQESIDDAQVTAEDHREIARELLREASAAATWARKAAAFINRVRVHGRESSTVPAASFAIRDVVAETQALLAHRLRSSLCRLDFVEQGDATLVGDSARMGQVLINLVANAIDAYEERDVLNGRIEIRAGIVGSRCTVTVRDWAGGIPPEHLPHVFDDMFTTKDAGRGTGIGLCISRSLIEQSFGGTLTVEVDPGTGSCFTISVPAGVPAAPARDAVA
jgi:C4-dicarboxylate-specific signal transduction histidine kinase